MSLINHDPNSFRVHSLREAASWNEPLPTEQESDIPRQDCELAGGECERGSVNICTRTGKGMFQNKVLDKSKLVVQAIARRIDGAGLETGQRAARISLVMGYL